MESDYSTLPFDGRTMFVGRYADSPSVPGQPEFIVENDPDVERIRSLVATGAMVRTRADADLQTDPELMRRALDGGAQIISTDFPAYRKEPSVGSNQAADGYAVGFGAGRLARVVE